MKKLPETNLWNRLKDRLGNYTEEPTDDAWDKIAAALPQPALSQGWVWVDRAMVAALLLLLSFTSGYMFRSNELESQNKIATINNSIVTPQEVPIGNDVITTTEKSPSNTSVAGYDNKTGQNSLVFESDSANGKSDPLNASSRSNLKDQTNSNSAVVKNNGSLRSQTPSSNSSRTNSSVTDRTATGQSRDNSTAVKGAATRKNAAENVSETITNVALVNQNELDKHKKENEATRDRKEAIQPQLPLQDKVVSKSDSTSLENAVEGSKIANSTSTNQSELDNHNLDNEASRDRKEAIQQQLPLQDKVVSKADGTSLENSVEVSKIANSTSTNQSELDNYKRDNKATRNGKEVIQQQRPLHDRTVGNSDNASVENAAEGSELIANSRRQDNEAATLNRKEAMQQQQNQLQFHDKVVDKSDSILVANSAEEDSRKITNDAVTYPNTSSKKEEGTVPTLDEKKAEQQQLSPEDKVVNRSGNALLANHTGSNNKADSLKKEKSKVQDPAVSARQSKPVAQTQQKKKENSRSKLYLSLTPSLAFQKIKPKLEDEVQVSGLQSAGVFSKERLGLSIEAGFEYQLSKHLEFYAGLSFYQQSQKISYEYQNEEVEITAAQGGGYNISPATSIKEFDYNMLNVGSSAGFLYTIKGTKLKHKIGAGLQYQKGLLKQTSEDTYDNASASYLNYQLSYRVDFLVNSRYSVFFQPTLTRSLRATEKLSEPFTINPHRAGIAIGIVYKL